MYRGFTDPSYSLRLPKQGALAEVEPGIPDGFRVDSRGRIWTSSGCGVQIFSQDGHRLGLSPTPQLCSNCCFSSGERRLFVASRQHLYAIDLTVAA